MNSDSKSKEVPILIDAVDHRIVLGRHVVGVTVLMLAQRPSAYRTGEFAVAWIAAAALVLGAAAIITGLAWLFFTRRESGRVVRTFAITAWTAAVLVLLGQWGPMFRFNGPAGDSVSTSASPVTPPADMPPRMGEQVAVQKPTIDVPRTATPKPLKAVATGCEPNDPDGETKLVARVYPKWSTTVKLHEFHEWFRNQSPSMQKLSSSTCASDAIRMLDAFEHDRATK